MEINPKCLDEIKHNNPPIACPSSFCSSVQAPIDQYCHDLDLPPDAPVLLFDPNLGGPGKGGYCWCCCCDCAYDTPIETAPGEFVLAQDVRVSDKLMAASLDPATGAPTWQQRTVALVTEPTPDVCLVAYAQASAGEAGEGSGALIVAMAQLFVMEDATLKPAQLLAPGDRLRRADGGVSEVLFAVTGWSTLGVRGVQLEGDFDGDRLDGHLLNANGVICADHAVQVHHAANRLAADRLHASVATAPRGDARESAAQRGSARRDAFVANAAAWPAGFTPRAGE